MCNSESSPNSIASTSVSDSQFHSKKRARVSWTEKHIINILDAGVSHRRCKHCSALWSINTSTGTISKHLLDNHSISMTSPSQSSSIVIQPPLDASKFLISRALEKKMDNSIAQYFITEILPHKHVESPGFRKFMNNYMPGYQIKSARTMK